MERSEVSGGSNPNSAILGPWAVHCPFGDLSFLICPVERMRLCWMLPLALGLPPGGARCKGPSAFLLHTESELRRAAPVRKQGDRESEGVLGCPGSPVTSLSECHSSSGALRNDLAATPWSPLVKATNG